MARWGLDLAPKAAACSVGSLPGQFIVGLSGLGWVPGLGALRGAGSGSGVWKICCFGGLLALLAGSIHPLVLFRPDVGRGSAVGFGPGQRRCVSSVGRL